MSKFWLLGQFLSIFWVLRSIFINFFKIWFSGQKLSSFYEKNCQHFGFKVEILQFLGHKRQNNCPTELNGACNCTISQLIECNGSPLIHCNWAGRWMNQLDEVPSPSIDSMKQFITGRQEHFTLLIANWTTFLESKAAARRVIARR